jgi:hypothetical protein
MNNLLRDLFLGIIHNCVGYDMGNQNKYACVYDETAVKFTKLVSTQQREFRIHPRNAIEADE